QRLPFVVTERSQRSLIGGTRVVQTTASGLVITGPKPTATNCAPSDATSPREFRLPEVRDVQAAPLTVDRIAPLLPTATVVVPLDARAVRSEDVGAIERLQATPSELEKIVPLSPTPR